MQCKQISFNIFIHIYVCIICIYIYIYICVCVCVCTSSSILVTRRVPWLTVSWERKCQRKRFIRWFIDLSHFITPPSILSGVCTKRDFGPLDKFQLRPPRSSPASAVPPGTFHRRNRLVANTEGDRGIEYNIGCTSNQIPNRRKA